MLPLITALLVGAVLIGIAALQYSANIRKKGMSRGKQPQRPGRIPRKLRRTVQRLVISD